MGCDDGFFLKANESASGEHIREATVKINAVEAVESYAAAHSETTEELINWPWKKFEALYDAFSKREASQNALLERNAYITGVLANTNLDDGKSTKRNMLESVDEDYQNRLRSIYNVINEDQIDIDSDPFYTAIKIPGRDFIPVDEPPVPENTTVNLEEIDVDQGGE